ncbi:MAG: hypothetical protein ABR884_01325 [Minisyncoccia bacterium]
MNTIEEKLIIKMYIEDKFSAVQISEFVHISVSKIVRILDVNNVQKRNISEAITQLNITKFHKVPFQLKSNLSPVENDLKLTGIMLYWGEGAKTGGGVKFANSNPEMICVFLRFLREICGVNEKRIKMMIHLYPDQSSDLLKNFWSSTTGVGLENFYRPHALVGKKGTYKNKSIYGTATINYSDKKLLTLILKWIEDYKNSFFKLPE